MLGDTVNARAVRILLECNLVLTASFIMFKCVVVDTQLNYHPAQRIISLLKANYL